MPPRIHPSVDAIERKIADIPKVLSLSAFFLVRHSCVFEQSYKEIAASSLDQPVVSETISAGVLLVVVGGGGSGGG